MKIPMSKAVDAASTYIIQEASKMTNNTKKFIAMAALGAARSNYQSIIANYADSLSMVGILDSEGCIDTTALKNGLEGAFMAVPRFEALGLAFCMDDAERIVQMMEQ